MTKKLGERRVHQLKTDPEWFKDARRGVKKFEIRSNDRDFCKGDIVILEEYNRETKEYSGESIIVEVIYICDFEQKHNNIVFGFEKLYHCTGLTAI
ncbi:DUF3850 domain-containing protein [Candidatus Enterococcus clewellii]|uniref:DUF3850 domain-containing protein n=1 Tax=Candidatus Enterococcus clewellii TaxID=1834193 RepID=UPI001BB0A156|nr:DUF3850 domain-containing protein [Enterococcus sp. 9E7_DIV0242]